MKYKPDFEQMIPRMQAWWNGELVDRACMDVSAPNGKEMRDPPEPSSLEEQWTNQDMILDKAEAEMKTTYYAGESFPFFRPNLGPDFFAAILGGTIEYRESTTWVAPFLDWDNPLAFEIETKGFYWKWVMEITEKAAERAQGKFLVSAHDCHSGGDALLAMRGGMDICLDLFDHPEKLHQAMDKLEKAVLKFHEAFWQRIEAHGQKGHTTAWMRVWSPGRSSAVQLDLLALISPEQFREFFYHELQVQCNALDNVIFHLDGSDALKHLPILYELPNITTIQWVHGAGNGPMTKWIHLLKEVQTNAKGLHLSCQPEDVETLLTELSSKGLFLRVSAESVEQADHLIKLAEKLAHE